MIIQDELSCPRTRVWIVDMDGVSREPVMTAAERAALEREWCARYTPPPSWLTRAVEWLFPSRTPPVSADLAAALAQDEDAVFNAVRAGDGPVVIGGVSYDLHVNHGGA